MANKPAKIRDVKTGIRQVSPTTAQRWLRLGNPRNRKITRKRVLRYVELMRTGKWELVPDAIMFDTDGVLINGHHRLTAVVESGRTVWFSVWENVSRDVLAYLDSGAPRTVAQNVYMIHGEKNSGFKTAVARYLRALDSGTYEKPDANEVLAYLERYETGFAWAMEAQKNRNLRKAFYWAPLIYMYDHFPDECQLFHMAMLEPYDQGQDSAAAALDRAFHTKLSTGGGGKNPFMQCLRVFNSFHRYVQEKLCKNLYASTTGYDALSVAMGRKSKRRDGSCSWTNCCNKPDLTDHPQCWVHRNFGAQARSNAPIADGRQLAARRAKGSKSGVIRRRKG